MTRAVLMALVLVGCAASHRIPPDAGHCQIGGCHVTRSGVLEHGFVAFPDGGRP